MKTQTDLVLEYMVENGGISAFDAYSKLGITRLSARIFDLRKAGVKITSTRIGYKAKDGRAKHYDVFRLDKTNKG